MCLCLVHLSNTSRRSSNAWGQLQLFQKSFLPLFGCRNKISKPIGMSADVETRGSHYATVRKVHGQQIPPSSLCNDSTRFSLIHATECFNNVIRLLFKNLLSKRENHFKTNFYIWGLLQFSKISYNL